jgi:hypothetical protein
MANIISIWQGIIGSLAFVGLIFTLRLCLFKKTLVMVFLSASCLIGLSTPILLFLDIFSVVDTVILVQLAAPIAYVYTSFAFISVSIRISLFLDPIPFDFRKPAFVRSVPVTLAILLGVFMLSILVIVVISYFGIPTAVLYILLSYIGNISMAMIDCFYNLYMFRLIRKNRFNTDSKNSKRSDSIKIMGLFILKVAIIVITAIIALIVDLRVTLITYGMNTLYVVTDGFFIILFKDMAQRFVYSGSDIPPSVPSQVGK